MVELAVFGSLMLLCLSFLVRYGQLYIYQQMVQQEAMRRAEVEGQYNAPLHSGSVVLLRDKRMVDPGNPFVAGPRQLFAANASLTMSNELLVNAPRAPFQFDSSDPSFDPNSFNPSLEMCNPPPCRDTSPGDPFNALPNQIPVTRMNMNGQTVSLRLAEYRTVPGATRLQICQYTDIYGQASVAVLNPFDVPADPSDDFLRYRCNSKFSVAKIKRDPFPPEVDAFTLSILDSCLGDVVDPKSCNRQCTDMCGLDLPLPNYCGVPTDGCNCHLPQDSGGQLLDYCTYSGIPDQKTVMGLDLDKTTRTRTINRNERVRSENLAVHQSSSHIDESERTVRAIKTSPIAKDRSKYDTSTVDGDHTISVDQTVNTKRDETFSTPW